MITAASTAAGTISNAQKSGSGSGQLQLTGDYSGTTDRDYLIQFMLAGEVGVAEYRWSGDGGVSFVASGVVITSVATLLNNGISVAGLTGSGTDFVLNDAYTFKAYREFGVAKLLDLDRDTEHRTATATAQLTYVLDLGEARTPNALIIDRHNFSYLAKIRLQGNTSDAWTSPAVNETVPWTDKSIVYYIAAERARYRYWRVFVDNIGNTDGYYRAAGLYLGRALELQSTVELGDSRRYTRVSQRRILSSGRPSGGVLATPAEFNLAWPDLSKFDRDQMVTLFAATNDLVNYQVKPVYFDPDSALGEVLLCEWEDFAEVASVIAAPYRYRFPLRLIEIPRTV